MKYKTLLALPAAAVILLTACGNQDSKDDPGKISESHHKQDSKKDNKDSGVKQSENKNTDKTGAVKQSDGSQSTTKADDGNEILKNGEKSEKFGKNDKKANNDLNKLPKNVAAKDNEPFRDSVNYIDFKGKQDITDVLKDSNIDNPTKVATDAQHEETYSALEKIWKDTQDTARENQKIGTSGSAKQSENIDKLVNKDYYGDATNVNNMMNYGLQDWHIDKSSLDVTDYGAKNVWMFTVNLVDKDGNKTAAVAGKYYGAQVKQVVILDMITSDKGVADLYSKTKNHKPGL